MYEPLAADECSIWTSDTTSSQIRSRKDI